MSEDIVILNGPYEVHPSIHAGHWAVVNAETGQVRADHMTRSAAVAYATELNDQRLEG